MLTISQLAAYVGVTVRTVRHYHRLGLLPEPERDHSGYRRYGAEDVIMLKRVSTLARSGVPLARISDLLEAGPTAFGRAIKEIDADLDSQIAELQQRRADLAELPSAERLCIPDEVAEILQREREIGLSEAAVTMERDTWILMSAGYPELLGSSLATKLAYLDDPEYRDLLLALDEALSWDPDDPRLHGLAERSMVVLQRLYPVETARRDAGRWNGVDPSTLRLMTEMNQRASPAWQRLYELVGELTREQGYPEF
ncbi:MAG TPA: MerR family transcriptional regulator [Microlunatus sp.]|nr:MerR family transcriptional regulator [Microlunatus sp.]